MTHQHVKKYVYLSIQGQLKDTPHAQSLYMNYIKGTGPLMQKYHVSVFAVGSGIDSVHTNVHYSVNALLRFPSIEAVDSFFTDPDYIQIKNDYRDPAYESLTLAVFTQDKIMTHTSLSHGKVTLVLRVDSSHQSYVTQIEPYLVAQGVHNSSVDAYWHQLELYVDCEDADLSMMISSKHDRVTQWNNRPTTII